MSKMSEMCIVIEEALDKYTGSTNFKSCQEIADLLEVPEQFVHQVVENRWKEKVKNESV